MAALLAACQSPPAPLNSERIAAKFGSYGVEVLSFDDGRRESCLYSLEQGQRICRSVAVVQFADLSANEHWPEIAPLQARIDAGASIGATFKETGWIIVKHTLYTGELELPADEQRLHSLMALDGAVQVAAHIYSFNLKNDSQLIDYAEILEVHHPDYLDLAALRALDPGSAVEALSPARRAALLGPLAGMEIPH